jgi:broad specificity phosphatase PhoE
LGFVFVAIGLAWFFEQRATTTVIFVRNADVDLPVAKGDDPPLNARGHKRAELLADFLEKVDVVDGVDAIYASKARSTQETAAPLARRLGLKVQIEDPHDVEGFMNDVRRQHKGQIVLIVADGNAIAPLVEELHGSKNIPQFGPDDYDNVYIVSIPWFGKVKTLRVRYALGSGLSGETQELTRTGTGEQRD